MWKSQIETIKSGSIQKFRIFRQQQLKYSEVIQLWQNDLEFCLFFNSLLANADFPAYFWETPSISLPTIEQPFEFVLVNNSRLQNVQANSHAFNKYFNSAHNIVTFSNLSKDAILVVPCPLVKKSPYTHIANFVRQAPSFQQVELWQKLGSAIQKNLTQQPIWVSTSGLGVYWLHIRLDSHPKYYTFQPYK